MNHALHIFRKDLRRLRWDVIALAAAVSARIFIDTAGADIALQGMGPTFAISELSFLHSLMYALLLALLVSRLVHDEPLVGNDAFWITRPIAPAALMTAKLAFAALFFVLVPLAAAVVVPAWFAMSGRDVASTVPAFVLNQIVFVTVLMALAVLTPSLIRYVLAIVGVIGSFVLLIAVGTLTALLREAVEETSSTPQMPDPTPAVVGAALVALAALAVIMYQYRRRRVARALAVAAVGAVVAGIVPGLWPWSFAPQPRVEAAALPPDTPDLQVSLDPSAPRAPEAFTLRRRTSPKRYIAVRAAISGVPDEFHISSVFARSRLELPAGPVFEYGRNVSATAVGFVNGSSEGRASTIEAALGARLLTANRATDALSLERWPTLLRIDELDFATYRRQPGRLTANLGVVFERAIVRGVVPLEDGVVREIDSRRFCVLRVIRRPTGCAVLLRTSHVEPLFSLPQAKNLIYVLHNTTRREAARSNVAEQLSDEAFFRSGGLSVSSPRFGGRGFVLEQFELQFPERMGPAAPPVDLDEAWVGGSELAILELIPAGQITRTVTVDGFRMAP